ncbi:MAG: MBL fold metallo-hydrolase, partial [Clostridia bacterium]|nr:MBL fold metallo-hydrolase [Clostridia bacterium]
MNITPLLTQSRTSYFSVDCGMSYIMRTADGKFVLIDSNWGEYDEPEHLLELLNAQNVNGGKPVIAAWFITHAHPDHYLGFVRLCERHAAEFIVEKIIYN